MKRLFRFYLSVFALCALLFAFCCAPPASAAGNSGVWPVDLITSGVTMNGVDAGVSIFAIDLTKKNHYTGNIYVQINGVTLSGVTPTGNGPAGTTAWPPSAGSGISVYYAESTTDPTSGTTEQPIYSVWRSLPWKIPTAGVTPATGNTVFGFSIPVSAAAPHVAIKLVSNGASQWVLGGIQYSTSGDPHSALPGGWVQFAAVDSAIGPLDVPLPWSEHDPVLLEAIARRCAIPEDWLLAANLHLPD